MGSVFIKRSKKNTAKEPTPKIQGRMGVFRNSIAKFFSEYQKIFIGVLCFIIFCALAFGVWFELSHSHEETFVFKNVRVVAATQIVAGLPIKMAALVDVNEMKNGKHLVRIPKSATDISVKKITPQEIKDLAKNKTTQITAQQKAEVLKNIKQVTKIDFRNNFLGNLLQGVNSFLADDEQAVENAVSAVLPDSNSQLVDVSAAPAAAPEQSAEQPASQPPAGGQDQTALPAPAICASDTDCSSGQTCVNDFCTTPQVEAPATDVAPSPDLTATTSPSDQQIVATPDITQTQPVENPADIQADKQPCQGDATDNCIAVQYTLPAPVITS